MISKIIFGFVDSSVTGTNFIKRFHNGLVADTGIAILSDLYLKLNYN